MLTYCLAILFFILKKGPYDSFIRNKKIQTFFVCVNPPAPRERDPSTDKKMFHLEIEFRFF